MLIVDFQYTSDEIYSKQNSLLVNNICYSGNVYHSAFYDSVLLKSFVVAFTYYNYFW